MQEKQIQEYIWPEYKKSEYVELQDRFYFCRHHLQALEKELEDKEFKCRCMPQRKSYYTEQISRDGQTLLFSGTITLAMIVLMVICIFNPNEGTAILLLLVSFKGAPQAVQSYGLIKNIMLNSKIKKGLDEEELDMRTRMYDIKIRLMELGLEKEELEKEIKLQDRIREIEGKIEVQ